MQVPDNMKKALFIVSIVVLSMFVLEPLSRNYCVLADPAGCCEQRPNANAVFVPNRLTFAACQQLNLALDNDNIFQRTGRVWWDLQCH